MLHDTIPDRDPSQKFTPISFFVFYNLKKKDIYAVWYQLKPNKDPSNPVKEELLLTSSNLFRNKSQE